MTGRKCIWAWTVCAETFALLQHNIRRVKTDMDTGTGQTKGTRRAVGPAGTKTGLERVAATFRCDLFFCLGRWGQTVATRWPIGAGRSLAFISSLKHSPGSLQHPPSIPSWGRQDMLLLWQNGGAERGRCGSGINMDAVS